MEAGPLKTVRSDWANTILICKKCSKKLGGGFGPKGRTPLAKALRRGLDVRKGRKGALGIVEVKCLGVCPKGAVTVIDGRAPGEWLLVPGGADVGEVAGLLVPPAGHHREGGDPASTPQPAEQAGSPPARE